MADKTKKIVKILLGISVLFLIAYGISFIPKKIDLTYDALMYSQKAYLDNDYENLDLKKTKLHINGKLYTPWFKSSYFIGYLDNDVAPLKKERIQYTRTFFREGEGPHYTEYSGRPEGSSHLEYLYTIYGVFGTDFENIFLEYKQYYGYEEYEGYCLVAPARDIKEIDMFWGNVLEITTVD